MKYLDQVLNLPGMGQRKLQAGCFAIHPEPLKAREYMVRRYNFTWKRFRTVLTWRVLLSAMGTCSAFFRPLMVRTAGYILAVCLWLAY